MRLSLVAPLRAPRACGASLGALLALFAGCGAEPESPTLLRSARREIRPTDGSGWQGNGYPAGVTVLSWDTPSGRYRIHFTKEGKHAVPVGDADGSGVPDFVEEFGKTFDHIYKVEVETLGFRPPLDDSLYHDRPDFGGDGRFDVYLQDMAGGADGYIVTEACKPGVVPKQCAGYMVVENDFVGFGYPTAKDGMRVLSSHEFFHIVQNAYRTDMARTWSEAAAVWATEQVFPEQKDFEGFIPYFFKNTSRSLDDEGGPADPFPYALAVWPTFLAEKFGARAIQAIHEELSEKGKSPTELDAVDAVLRRDHKSSLAGAFAEFALWNYFTGERAAGMPGYKAAASFPKLEPRAVAGALPQRIAGEIAYLSAQYFKLGVAAGTRVKVVVERPQPELALHLITGDPKHPTVASIGPEKSSATIDARGELVIVAASTARRDRHLPLSLAVSEEIVDVPPPPSPPSPPAPSPPTSEGSGGGCSLAGGPAALPLALALLAPLAVRRRSRGLCLLLALAACSDKPAAVDVRAPDGEGAREAGPREARPPEAAKHDAHSPLAVGRFADFTADASGRIVGSTPTAGSEEYLLLLTSHQDLALKVHKYKASAGSSQPMQGAGAVGGTPWPERRCRFQAWLSELAASRPRALRAPRPWRAGTLPPKLGEVREFAIGSGASTVKINAECVRVDGTAAFWLDRTTQPAAAIDATALAALADGFAKIIVPRERIYFGKESDLDGDGLISVLLSPLVATDAVAYFSPCDLVDPKLVPVCAGRSNQMEILYLSPPSSLKPPMNTPAAMLETVAHELQHAIYFNRKFLLNGGGGALDSENPYLTEGLSALAQDLSGYQAGNFYVMKAGLDGVDDVSVPNLTSDAIKSYVPQPADGIMRGAGYLLLRYLFDRAGGDALDANATPVDKGGISWLRKLVDAKETGEPNVLKASGLAAADLIGDFWAALALSNRGPGGTPLNPEARYNFQATTTDPLTTRQRGANLWGSFHGVQATGPKTQPIAAADGSLRAGGAELLVLVAKPGNPALGFTVETDPAAQARARLIRIR